MPRRTLGVSLGPELTSLALIDPDEGFVAATEAMAGRGDDFGIGRAVRDLARRSGEGLSGLAHITVNLQLAAPSSKTGPGWRRIAVLRIGAPSAAAVSPFATWPEELTRQVNAGWIAVNGGRELDGRVVEPLDREGVTDFLRSATQAEAVAICGVLSGVSPEFELEAAEIARKVLGEDVHISMSHELGTIGIIERENATIINAATAGAMSKQVGDLADALRAAGIIAPLYVAQNDGTATIAQRACAFPLLSRFSSNACGAVGGAFLSRRPDALIITVADNATELCASIDGTPRTAWQRQTVHGVRILVRASDSWTMPLGLKTQLPIGRAQARVAAGKRTTLRASSGDTISLEEAATVAGRLRRRGTPMSLPVKHVLARADEQFEEAILRTSPEAGPLPMVAVGRGAGVVPSNIRALGTMVVPPHGESAEAVGAAIAQVGGYAECLAQGEHRETAIAHVSALARDRAVLSGADPGHVHTVAIEEIPLAYVATPTLLIRVQARGPMVSQ